MPAPVTITRPVHIAGENITPAIFNSETVLSASVPDATTSAVGVVELAAANENAANLAVQANDPRLSNARPPTAHIHAIADVTDLQAALDGKAPTSHGHPVAQISGLGDAAVKNTGATPGTLCAGDDARLSDSSVFGRSLMQAAGAPDARGLLNLSAAATANFGTGAGSVCEGDDERLVPAFGNFVPTALAGTTTTYNFQFGSYVKIGQLVLVTAQLSILSIGDGNKRRIGGLPFVNATDDPVAVSLVKYNNLASSVADLTAFINGGGDNQIIFAASTAVGSGVSESVDVLGDGTQINFSAVYLAPT